jgi:hypothetical protein
VQHANGAKTKTNDVKKHLLTHGNNNSAEPNFKLNEMQFAHDGVDEERQHLDVFDSWIHRCTCLSPLLIIDPASTRDSGLT